MLPEPLHPALVHLPIALAVLVPLAALAALAAISRAGVPPRAWLAVVALQALLLGSAWLAVETGEGDEERVEHVVAERYIEAHEEAGERFLLVAGIGLAVVAAGLLPGSVGRAGRLAGTAMSGLVLAAAITVGHSGGELVYRHGAALAYVSHGTDAPAPERHAARRAHREEDDSDRD